MNSVSMGTTWARRIFGKLLRPLLAIPYGMRSGHTKNPCYPSRILRCDLQSEFFAIKSCYNKDLARSAGIEPTTPGFGGRYSIH